jgi:hypothetical protein
MLISVAVADPSWTDIMTAVGTVAAAAAAVGIAGWSHWQAVKERARSHEREQLAEAYEVQVVQGERPAPGQSASSPSALMLAPGRYAERRRLSRLNHVTSCARAARAGPVPPGMPSRQAASSSP